MKIKIFCGVVVLFSFLLLDCHAAVPFGDNFNTYDNGQLNGQGGWTDPGWGGEGATVQDTNVYEGTKAVSFTTGYIQKYGDTISSGTWYFFAKGCGGDNYVHFRNQANALVEGILVWRPAEGYCQVQLYSGSMRTIYNLPSDYFNVWREVGIEWDGSLNKHRVWVEGQAWSDWWGSGGAFSGIKGIIFRSISAGLSLDKISGEAYVPPPAGYSLIIEPNYPVDCQQTIIASPLTFTATGKITIPTDNEFYWKKFYVWAFDLDNAISYNASTTFSPVLKAGDIINYSIPLALPDGVYKISYSLEGYHPTQMWGIIEAHYCEATHMGTMAYVPPGVEAPEFPGHEPEDCSGYPILERLVCEIKNFIKGLVFPTASKINTLKTNLSAFHQKIPLNYLSAGKNFFANIQSGVATTTPSISILGSPSAALNFEFLMATKSIAGQNISLQGVFKIFSSTILLLVLMVWGIDFKNRIFK